MNAESRSRCRVAEALSIVALGVAAPANAADYIYALDTGLGYSDNIAKTAENQIEEKIAAAGVTLGVQQSTSRMDLDLSMRVDYLDYLDDTFDSEIVGSAVGAVTVDIVRDRFMWMLEDTYGQTLSNQFSPSTPANRQTVNYLTTGPDLLIPLTSRMRFRLDGRYSDVKYEDSELGNERVLGGLALERDISEASTLAVRGEVEDVTYDDEELVDFQRQQAFLRYALASDRTTISADLGYSEIERLNISTGGVLARLYASRLVSPSFSLSLDAGREFSDAGNLFRDLQAQEPSGGVTQPVQLIADVFTNTYGVLGWDFFRNRTGFYARAGYYEERYEQQIEFDRTRQEYNATLERQLSSTLTVEIGAGYSDYEFTRVDRTFSQVSGTFDVRWHLGRRSFLSFEYLYYDRSDSLEGGEFRENQVWLRVGIVGGTGEMTEGRSFATRPGRL